ncbi:MAG: hypothetical protein JXC31_04790, partial [Acholeplasmataceae bacterium]|nr:hypothetical protein [Acholeplasmataceae bacterium]
MDTRELLILSYAAYQQEKYEEAYQILMDNKKYIAKDSMLYNYIFSLTSKLNRTDEALFYLNEAIITYDMWYNIEVLDNDTDLDTIRDLPEFKKLHKICKQKAIDHKYAGVKKIDIDAPENGTKNLFFMLHGNSQYVERVKKYFNPTSVKNHIIALPQSREFQAFQNYAWNNADFGLKVAKEHYQEVIASYDIHEENIILSSFSSGAQVILKGLLENELSAKKAVFFSPWIPQLGNLEEQIKVLKERDVKIFIVCGTADQSCFPIANHFDELLTKYNVDHQYKVIKDFPHTLPTDAEVIMDEVLTYF